MDTSLARRPRFMGQATALCAASLLLGSTSLADSPIEAFSSGNVEKGELHLPLIRGAAMQPEVTVPVLPHNCERHVDMTVRWDEEADWVKVKLRGKGVLEQFPNITRTAGVNFFPNPFWAESKDIVSGRYQFWFISPAGNITFYYDGTTLDLLGSEFDFATPPPGSIPVSVVSVKVVGSQLFRPDSHGDLDVDITWAYSGLVRLDRPEFAHHIASFPVHNLCGGNPFRYDLSTTRGYISKPRPASEARPFDAYFRNGLFYQITVEPADYYTDPPLDTQFSTYSNGSIIAGNIPNGYTWDIDASFMNLAPPIKPWEGAGRCQVEFNGVHTQNLNFCGP